MKKQNCYCFQGLNIIKLILKKVKKLKSEQNTTESKENQKRRKNNQLDNWKVKVKNLAMFVYPNTINKSRLTWVGWENHNDL